MSSKPSILDISTPEFDVDAYLSGQLKDKTLDQLVKEEEEMVSAVRRLDSDVHQLVYENYNKFLTATSTVRKIQDEFNLLDAEMESLTSSMKTISDLIGELGGTMTGGREDLVQLGSSYKIVKSLQFIFDLPSALSILHDERKFSELVRLYTLSKTALSKYQDVKNVAEIIEKIEGTIAETAKELRKIIAAPVDKVDDITVAVQLLLKLGFDSHEISNDLIKSCGETLALDLETLQRNPADVLDLVDRGCGSFIPNLTLLANLHSQLFPKFSKELLTMLQDQLNNFHAVVSRLFLSSDDPKDCSIVVRAFDRYFRKMSTCKHVVLGLDCSSLSIGLIREVSVHEITISRNKINEKVRTVLIEIRESMLTPPDDLQPLSNRLEQTFTFQVKTALANLLLFTASDVTFSTLPPQEFQTKFAHSVYEKLLIESFRDMCTELEFQGNVENGAEICANPVLLLVLAVSVHHLASKSAHYLTSLCREQFSLINDDKQLSSVHQVTSWLKACSQSLISAFVWQRGIQLGDNLVKGCEAMTQPSASPNGVRAPVRRVVEEMVECEKVLSHLLGGEQRKEQRSRARAADAPRDSLWCERIDFHQQVHLSKPSVLSGLVKIVLKCFTECVRLKTYGKYGVEQIQIDCYYLQRGLAPLVADEVVVNSMVDQSLSSALKRCKNPELIHPSRLVQICDGNRGKLDD